MSKNEVVEVRQIGRGSVIIVACCRCNSYHDFTVGWREPQGRNLRAGQFVCDACQEQRVDGKPVV